MTHHHPRSSMAALVLALASWYAMLPAQPLASQDGPKGQPGERASPPELPLIGLWMIAREGTVADWLGQPHRGKRLLEPINVIIQDPFAASPEEATARLVEACRKSGFPEREGHSSGYSGMIADSTFPQVPLGTEDSFSDAPFAVGNDHGRIFGAALWKGAYWFTAAFSRESVDLVTKVKHLYVSFDRARDAFTQKLAAHSDYQIAGFIDLNNDLLTDPQLTTGDHDGMAVLVKATR